MLYGLDDLAFWIVSHPNWMTRPWHRWARHRVANFIRMTDALREGTEFERGEPHAD